MVVLVVVALVEDPVEASPVEASPVVDFPVEAGFLLPLTGPVETLPMPRTSASTSSFASPSSRALFLAAVERVQ